MSQIKNVEDFLATARARFQQSVEAENKWRLAALEDLRFFDGDQWPEEIRESRKNEGRPCLTFPVIEQFVHQVSNEFRKNKPSPTVVPVDDNADVDTAETIMGLIRKVQRQSHAAEARAYAQLYATICGRGAYRITTDYESDDSFDQDIFVERIKNQFGVYPDPTCQKPDYSDQKYCFIVEDWLREEYKTEYPKSEGASGDWTSIGDQQSMWCTEDTIRVAEYFYIETTDAEIALIAAPDGTSIVLPLEEVPEGVEILKQRKVKRKQCCWAKINGLEVLEEKKWPIPFVPVLFITGEELQINGETSLKGMVRGMKSAQQQYNYMRTMQTETIALAPRAPYVIDEGQLEGHEEIWANANTKSYAFLPYKARLEGGHPVPPPRRENFEPAIQAITMAVGQAYEDLKRSSGIHDASLGARSNETSGRAIIARQEEGDTANYHFHDNARTTITHECRMILALIPVIYDRPGRVARIVGEEDDEKTVTLNAPFADKGIEKIYDVTIGRYDVAADVGPGFATKRKQAADMLMQLTQAFPALMQVAGDVLVKSMDIPGAREIGERLKKLMPPEVREDEGDDQQQQLGQLQAQNAQMGQMVDELSAALEESSDEIKTNRAALESKERIETAKLEFQREQFQAEMQLELAKLGSQEGMLQLREELAAIKHHLEMDRAAEQAEIAREDAREQREFEAEQSSAEQAGGLPAAA